MMLKKFSNLLCLIGFVGLYQEVSRPIIIITIFSFLLQFLKKFPKLILTLVRVILISLTIFLMWKKFHSFLITEVGISFMLVMSFLKLGELDSENDYFNMFLILILLEGCVFISNPSLLIFIFGLIKMLAYFYFLIKLQNYELNLLNIKRVLLLALPAILFAIGLYFTFPRFTQGFIGFNTRDFFAATGNTNINFFDLKEFVPSDKSVFKVFNFKSNRTTTNLYWKTNHLWDFRNNQWRLSNIPFKESSKPTLKPRNPMNYIVKTENVYVDYVPHLDTFSAVDIQNNDLTYFSDNVFKLKPPKKGMFVFSIFSSSEYNLAATKEIEKGLRLQDNNKLKYQSLILKENKSNLSIEQRLKLVVNFFIQKKYRYSLSPRSYSGIADFIDNGTDGYCSHFASSFAYLLRTVNIASRVVIGYQGGNFNQFDDSILIKEKDSHAWVEFVNSKNQWVRIDPTELVIPERIQLGSDNFFSSLNSKNGFLSQLVSLVGKNQFIDQAQDFFNYIESISSSGLFNIDQIEQKKLMKNFSGYIFSLLFITFIGFFYFVSKHFILIKKNKAEETYYLFLKKMKKRGYIKLQHETATEFASRICLVDDSIKEYVTTETNNYVRSMYERKK